MPSKSAACSAHVLDSSKRARRSFVGLHRMHETKVFDALHALKFAERKPWNATC